MFGKLVSELQTGVNVDAAQKKISGTLNYIDSYPLFSSTVDEQKGNYLALKVDPTPSNAEIKMELIGGTAGEVKLDQDKNIVLLIKDNRSETLKVTATALGYTGYSETFSLEDLTLSPSGDV